MWGSRSQSLVDCWIKSLMIWCTPREWDELLISVLVSRTNITIYNVELNRPFDNLCHIQVK